MARFKGVLHTCTRIYTRRCYGQREFQLSRLRFGLVRFREPRERVDKREETRVNDTLVS